MRPKPTASYESVERTRRRFISTERTAILAAVAMQIDTVETTMHLAENFTIIAELEEKVEETFCYILSGLARLGQCADDAKSNCSIQYKAFRDQVTESRKVAAPVEHHLSEFLEIVVPVISDVNGTEDQICREEAMDTLTDFIQDLPKHPQAKSLNTFGDGVSQHSSPLSYIQNRMRLSISDLTQFLNLHSRQITRERDELNSGLQARSQEILQLATQAAPSVEDKYTDSHAPTWPLMNIVRFRNHPMLSSGIGATSSYSMLARHRRALESEAGKEDDANRTRLVEVQQTLLGLSDLIGRVDALESEIAALAAGLDRCNKAWAGLIIDAKILRHSLASASGLSRFSYQKYLLHLKICTRFYATLHRGLKAYSKQTSVQGLSYEKLAVLL